MKISRGHLGHPAVHALLSDHLNSMNSNSPPESVHALGLRDLAKPEVSFWTVWEGDALLGCGAMKRIEPKHGEIKSMKTSSDHLRKGVAAKLLAHIIAEARQSSYERLSLETGSAKIFEPARKLYKSFGFVVSEPFGEYQNDPYSVFMSLSLLEQHEET